MIIVTGGAGFIGSIICAELQRHNYKDIVVADWLGSDDKWKNIAKRELHSVVTPENLETFIDKHVDKIEAIIHMGAISTTTEKDVDLINKSNFELTSKLWEWCTLHNKRFIYASSAATYGSGEQGFSDNDDLTYLNNLRPLNPYGWSKAVFDRKVARILQEGGKTPAQHVGLKFFNVYGPNEYHKGGQKSVIAHIFPDVKNNRPAKLFKSYNPKYQDGGQLRDFVWVGDVADIVIWFLKNPDKNGLFNVGTGKARSFADLALATFKALNLVPKIDYIEMPETLRGKYQYYTQADMQKLYSIGYPRPMTELEDGVRQYVQDFLNKEDMYL